MRIKEEDDVLIVKTSLSLLTSTCRDFFFSGALLHSFFKVYININFHVFFRTSEKKKVHLDVCNLKNMCGDFSFVGIVGFINCL